MAGRHRRGKEPATEPSGGPAVGNPDNALTVVNEQGCRLIIESNKIPETPLQRAVCDGRRCVAMSRKLQDAYNMHNTLVICNHPNILKPIGVWADPSDNSKAYIAVTSVDSALNCLAMEQLFCVEGQFLRGFSELGFKVFRDIFSAIHYINSTYEGGATSSASNSPPIPLFPMMLEPKNIFVKMVNGQAHVMLGNFKTNLSNVYLAKSSRGSRRDRDYKGRHRKSTLEGSWTLCLTQLYRAHNPSKELTELAEFLTKKEVTYESLLWQPGLWDARTKMQFIREIYFLLDNERDSERTPFESTPRGKILKGKSPLGLLPIMKDFSPPLDRNNQEKQITENNLLGSVIFLRHKIVAHFDEEYPRFKGSKAEIGTSVVTRERYIHDYMISLAETVRALGWIAESPVVRGENDYMSSFYKMRI